MKTKISTMIPVVKPRINVITLGCSKNIHDSEVLMGQLRGNQMNVTHEAEDLDSNDIIVINTCGFIDNAKQESIDTILQYSQLKDEGRVGSATNRNCKRK